MPRSARPPLRSATALASNWSGKGSKTTCSAPSWHASAATRCRATCTASRCPTRKRWPTCRLGATTQALQARLTDDLAPLRLEVAHQYLVVQLVHFGRHARHVGRKTEQPRQGFAG